MTGTTIAQAIPVFISPILTRLYTPNDFGIAAIYMAIVMLFSSIATLRYELAIMLPKEEEDALNVAALGIFIATMLSFLLLVIIIIFNYYICNLLNNQEISFWLYLAPFSIFFIGLFNVLQYYNNRIKLYKDLAKANVYKSITSAIVRLTVVLIQSGPTGLILGQISSQIVANTKLLSNVIRKENLNKIISFDKMKYLAKKYDDFPKYSTIAVLANTSSYQITNILISTFFSVTTLGYYSLVQRILGMPSNLIGKAIGQVYYQQAAEEKIKTGTSINIFRKTTLKLALISLPFYIVLYFIVEDLFSFVFGEKWIIAGEYARILIPLYYVRFFVSPITLTNQIYLKNKLGMIWQLGLLFISLVILTIGYLFNFEFKSILLVISIVILLYFLFLLFLIYSYIKNS